MTGLMKNSAIGKAGGFIVKLWNKSCIGWYFTRNINDVKIRHSYIYKLFNMILKMLTSFAGYCGEKIDSFINKSIIVSVFNKLGTTLARYFKNSLLCRFTEKILECEFDFTGIRMYQLVVFLVVFIAPIAPTMVNAALAVIAFALFLIDCVRRKSFPKKLDSVSFLVFSLIFIFGFYAVFSLAPNDSIKIWFLYTVFMSFFFLVMNTVTSKQRLYGVASLMVFSGLLVSLFGVYQKFFGTNLGHAWIDEDMFGEIAVRVYSTLDNPNVLGEYLLLVIPIGIALLWTRKTWLSRLYYAGAVGVMLICMVFTQSRGCWLGLLLAIAVFAVFVDWRLVVFGIAALFVLPFVLPESIIARFASIGNVGDSSTSYRVFIWLGTINMLRDFGIYGIGLGSDAFNKVYPFYSYSTIKAPHSHNIYLQLLCETGVVGLGVFLTTMAVSLKKMLLTTLSDRKGFCGILSIAVIAGLLGFLLQGAFDYVWYNYRVFLVFWMVIALGIAARRVKDDKADTCN